MKLQEINLDFSICKVDKIEASIWEKEYTFIARTDNELSIICTESNVPSNTISREDGWKCFRIAEDAAFEKYGMIAFLTRIIADVKTGVLVVATYDTDYLLVKKERYCDVREALLDASCEFQESI